MTSNDSTTTARYNVYTRPEGTQAGFASWEAANECRTMPSTIETTAKRIWDYSTTPPTDVTDADPEGPHAMTPHPGKRPAAPTIPKGVKDLTIKRGDYGTPRPIYVTMGSGLWSASFTTTDEELFTRIHDVAETMRGITK